MVRMPFRKAGSGREAFLEGRSGWEALLKGRKPSKRTGSVWNAHLEGWEWLGDPLGEPKVVGRPFQRAGSGRESLSLGQEWS